MEIALMLIGAALSLGGSFAANWAFYGKMEKSRAEREDLRYALADVNEKFDLDALVHKAIGQAAELRKQQEQQYGQRRDN